MPRPLDKIRTDIDELDECIVHSFFDGFPANRNPGETLINQKEVDQILSVQLRFSRMTWQLINARMQLSEEVGKTKKESGETVVIDKERFKTVIKQAQSHAPESAHTKIQEFYELIHEISVRIQNGIIKTQ